MDWKFRKDFQVMPGVYIKYGNDGIKTQIRSERMDHFDTDLAREKIRHNLFKPYEAQYEIKSARIDKLTSPELEQLKSVLLSSGNAYEETKNLFDNKSTEQVNRAIKLEKLKRSLFKYFYKGKIARMERESVIAEEEIEELKKQLDFSTIRLEIDSEDVFIDLYKNVRKAFALSMRSKKIWDLTSSKQTNRVAERTSASSTVTRTEVDLSEQSLPIIQTSQAALCFHNVNGGNLYLYPGFVIVYESKVEFAVVNYTDLSVTFKQTRFIESEKVPEDTKIIDHTWFKVNKDGSPDRRFSNNFQIPVVQYAELHFKSGSGLNEVYCFSNVEYSMLFQKALSDYIDALKTANSLFDEFNK